MRGDRSTARHRYSRRNGRAPAVEALTRKEFMRTDCFYSLVYVVAEHDLFLVVDHSRRPQLDDYVVVDSGAGVLTIERYMGQDCCGVVRWLDFYALQHSEQRQPQNARGQKSA